MDRTTPTSNTTRDHPLIGIVGPCGAGKSTLIHGLETLGYRCRHIAQEHSYVQQMWKRITNPDLLVYLHASFRVCTARRKLNWIEADYLEQIGRLEHARLHADLSIDTNERSPQQVLQDVLDFLARESGPPAT